MRLCCSHEVYQRLGLRNLQSQSLTDAFITFTLWDNHSYVGYGRWKRSTVFYWRHKIHGDDPSKVPQGAATALLFHMRLLYDVMTGGQSVIQSDKLPVAGMNRVSAARLLLLPVKGQSRHSESLQMLQTFGPWARPPVIMPDNGSSLPDFGHCHWTAVHVFFVMRCGSLRKKEGCFYVKLEKIGSWASLLPFPLSVHFHPDTKPCLHAALMPIKGLN